MRVDGTQNDRYDVYVIDADGSNLKQLSHSGKDGLPAWSPDGEKILFSSDRNGLGDLYIMNADGSDEQPLTNAPANLEGDVDWQPINGLIGDTDCDGDVEADDSQAVLAYLVGLAVPDCVFTLGNVICDEPPVLADAVAILQYVAFNESRVPAYCLPIGT